MSLARHSSPTPWWLLASATLLALLLGEANRGGTGGTGPSVVAAQTTPASGSRPTAAQGAGGKSAGKTPPAATGAANSKPAAGQKSATNSGPKTNTAGTAAGTPRKQPAPVSPPAAARPADDRPADDRPGTDEPEEESDDTDDNDPPTPEPAQGSAEWLVREAARLRIEPIPEGTSPADATRLVATRQQKVIDLSQRAIALVHQDAQRQLVFSAAARYLLEARLELAIAGDEEQADLLADEARAFYRRDPQSDAAGSGVLCLARYAHAQAVHAKQDQAEWRVEFTRHARQLLERFPKQRAQALLLAHTAGRLAEEHGQLPEALACFDAVSDQAPETPQGEESAALARRLRLPGNPPRITGTTLAGDEFDLDDLLGQPVLVVFWASTSKPFVEGWTQARPVIEAACQRGLQVVGVCLDTDAKTAGLGAKQFAVPGPQLFSGEPEQSGWNNPIARHYAVFDLPTFWLIDVNGNVVSTRLTPRDLKRELARQLDARQVGQAGGDSEEAAPASGVRPTGATRSPSPAATPERDGTKGAKAPAAKAPARAGKPTRE